MKIHLHQNPEGHLNGYTNICLSKIDNIDDELDTVVEDAEATEIIANNVLEFIPLPKLVDFLQHLIRKLRHGGTLLITGVDAYAVAKDYVAYKLSIEDFNILIHGHQGDEHNTKLATLSLHGMVYFLKDEFALTILRQALDDYNYIIEVQRP